MLRIHDRAGRGLPRHITPALCTALLALAGGALLAGCGNDEPDKGPPGSKSNPLVAVPNPQPTRTPPQPGDDGRRRARDATPDPKSDPEAALQPATRQRSQPKASKPGRTRAASGERSLPLNGTADPTRPCTLVPKAQAQALMGGPILEPVEARQGPTCLYRSSSGKRFVSLAIQRTDLAELRKQMRADRRVSVAGKSAWCGGLGQPVLYVRLARGSVLTVNAPCELAARFAARAVVRLKV